VNEKTPYYEYIIGCFLFVALVVAFVILPVIFNTSIWEKELPKNFTQTLNDIIFCLLCSGFERGLSCHWDGVQGDPSVENSSTLLFLNKK